MRKQKIIMPLAFALAMVALSTAAVLFGKEPDIVAREHEHEPSAPLMRELGELIADPIMSANAAVKKQFPDFDAQQYISKVSKVTDKDVIKRYPELDAPYITDLNYKIDNAPTRVWYQAFAHAFKNNVVPKLEKLYKNGTISLETYAKICSKARHFARLFTREHMKSERSLCLVRERDRAKYGFPNGPTFDGLMIKKMREQREAYEGRNKGKLFDERPVKQGGNFDDEKAYREIIASATTLSNLFNWAESWGVSDWWVVEKSAAKYYGCP